MYNPQRYQSQDISEIFEFMDKNPFATLISVVDGKPFVSHLPVTSQKKLDQIEVVGHLAKANPHWKYLNHTPLTIIFHGAHTYVTPQWYVEQDVPTWNYSVLHAWGQATLIEEEQEIIKCLKELTDHAERHWPSGWDFFIPEDLSGGVLNRHIVGFKVKLNEYSYKKKLSQNRNPADRVGVLRGLESRKDQNSHAVLADMRKLYDKNGQLKKP